MNKSQIADRLAGRMGLSRSAAAGAVDAVFQTIDEALAHHEEVRIGEFGTFATNHRPARTGRNPGTGIAVSTPALGAPAFRAVKALKEAGKLGVPRTWRCRSVAERYSEPCKGKRIRHCSIGCN